MEKKKLEDFYQPYNFIPVSGFISFDQANKEKPRAMYDYHDRKLLSHSSSGSASAIARHDVWQSGHHSGCFECTLRIVSPTVVGNKHSGENPTKVEQYKWKEKTALPANSLRGMVASLAELLSQSSLRVLKKEFWPAFAAIEPDLVPWNNKRFAISGLTPAELMFGVVEDNSGQETGAADMDTESTRNLASRIRFSDGLLSVDNEDNVQGESVVLKELASPKPTGYQGEGSKDFKTDRPSLYFWKKNHTGPITYDELEKYFAKSNPPHPLPNGRKIFLVRKNPEALGPVSYRASNKKGCNEPDVKNKMEARLIKPGTVFTFRIDFEDLTDAEVTLLQTSLIPDADFLHRLGLGKALGLGIVQVDITKTSFTDRKLRYSVNGLTLAEGQLQQSGQCHQEDLSLIDKETLTMLRKAGSIKHLDPELSIQWRKGYSDEQKQTAPMPPLIAGMKFLPSFYQLESGKDSQTAERKPPVEKIPKDAPCVMTALVGEETASCEWLRDSVSTLNNNQPFALLDEPQVQTRLVGPAVAKQWKMINDQELKSAVKELILSIASQCGLESFWNSGGSKRAKKIYDSWSKDDK